MNRLEAKFDDLDQGFNRILSSLAQILTKMDVLDRLEKRLTEQEERQAVVTGKTIVGDSQTQASSAVELQDEEPAKEEDVVSRKVAEEEDSFVLLENLFYGYQMGEDKGTDVETVESAHQVFDQMSVREKRNKKKNKKKKVKIRKYHVKWKVYAVKKRTYKFKRLKDKNRGLHMERLLQNLNKNMREMKLGKRQNYQVWYTCHVFSRGFCLRCTKAKYLRKRKKLRAEYNYKHKHKHKTSWKGHMFRHKHKKKIPRASASAVAFGMGLFSEKRNLGPGRNRAFAVTSENRASDTKLRFFECCQNYKSYRKAKRPDVDNLKEPVLSEITAYLAKRYDINFTKQDISSLWFLCKQEASLLNVTNQSCELFTPSEVALLEWTDDLEVFILKGYGNSLNYKMGAPLLEDVLHSMEEAIKAREENLPPGSYEKARLRFAHAETIVPFSCLLGLFLDKSEFKKIEKEQPLELPPQPPKTRDFKGSTMAPFGGNNMLVLYSCPVDSSPKYYVQVLHNEHPIAVPGCDGKDLCPLKDFKTKVVTPHLKHAFENICNADQDNTKQKPASSKLSLLSSWLSGSSPLTEL